MVILSLIYWALRRVLELVMLRRRSERCKELEIVLLRHELQVLRRQVARPRLKCADRALLAAFSRALPGARWGSLLVTPGTLMRWHVGAENAAFTPRAGTRGGARQGVKGPKTRIRVHLAGCSAHPSASGLPGQAGTRDLRELPRGRAERVGHGDIQVCLQCDEVCVHGRSAHTPAEREPVQGECAGQTSANGQVA